MGWRGKATNSLYAVLRPEEGANDGKSGGVATSRLPGLSKGRDPGGRGRGVGEKGGCGARSRAQPRRSPGLVGAMPASLRQRKAGGRGNRRLRTPGFFRFLFKGAAGEGKEIKKRDLMCAAAPAAKDILCRP